MINLFFKRRLIQSLSTILTIAIPNYLVAAEGVYSSELVNQSKQQSSNGFKLIKTKMWPNNGCLIDTGKQIVNPGESTTLKIKKDMKCNESGVGYSIYRLEDMKNEHLFGYLSHRFADGKFSIQISRFCEGNKCVFMDLNPEQSRKNPN